MITRSLLVRIVCSASVLAAAVACSKTDSAPPVASVTFAASRTKVTLGSPVDLTYKFTVAPTAKINGDYKVFVHVLSDEGQKIWDDDHDPDIPTSQWKPGQTIEYTHTKFVPAYPYLGKATVQMGLYKGQERLPLTGPDPADRSSPARAYKVGTLEILPSSSNVFVRRPTGWHEIEYAANDPSLEWQWTGKSAVFLFQNPKKDVTLYLEYDARTDIFPEPQKVSLMSGTQVITTFVADNASPVLKRIPIAAAQLGTGDTTELRLEVDKPFVPANLPNGGKDKRELGIRVYQLFVEPK